MAKSFYETLGVSRTASEKEIKTAYRKLARRHHPDVNPGDRAAETRFKEINGAFEVLSDPEKRRKYDKYGDRWEMADQIEEAQRRQSPSAWARQGGAASGPGAAGGSFSFDTGGGDFGSIFDSLFRRERGQPAARRGQDVETPVDVTLEEAYHGTTRTVSLQAVETCKTCSGNGEAGGTVCPTCDGNGTLLRPRRLEVRVPQGVKTGSRVRVAGEGRPGAGGGPAGDLYLVLTVREHARFERKGDNLVTDVNVPLIDAVLGGEATLQTIDGRVALRIPELSQAGRQIRLSGKGMPVLGQEGKRGDLYARVRVVLPAQLSPEERNLFEQIKALQAAHTAV